MERLNVHYQELAKQKNQDMFAAQDAENKAQTIKEPCSKDDTEDEKAAKTAKEGPLNKPIKLSEERQQELKDSIAALTEELQEKSAELEKVLQFNCDVFSVTELADEPDVIAAGG
jgi:hypothetical protein